MLRRPAFSVLPCPHKLHIPRPFRYSSSPKCKRWRWFAFWFFYGAAKKGAYAPPVLDFPPKCVAALPLIISDGRTESSAPTECRKTRMRAGCIVRPYEIFEKRNAPAYSSETLRRIRRCVIILSAVDSPVSFCGNDYRC